MLLNLESAKKLLRLGENKSFPFFLNGACGVLEQLQFNKPREFVAVGEKMVTL